MSIDQLSLLKMWLKSTEEQKTDPIYLGNNYISKQELIKTIKKRIEKEKEIVNN